MSGYLSGHAILSSGVRGRKGSYRKGGKKRGRERRKREREEEAVKGTKVDLQKKVERKEREGTIRSSYHPLA